MVLGVSSKEVVSYLTLLGSEPSMICEISCMSCFFRKYVCRSDMSGIPECMQRMLCFYGDIVFGNHTNNSKCFDDANAWWYGCRPLILIKLRIVVSFKGFTPANTLLDKPSMYPELGSSFKAAFVKACAWFFTKTAVEISETNPSDSWTSLRYHFFPWVYACAL